LRCYTKFEAINRCDAHSWRFYKITRHWLGTPPETLDQDWQIVSLDNSCTAYIWRVSPLGCVKIEKGLGYASLFDPEDTALPCAQGNTTCIDQEFPDLPEAPCPACNLLIPFGSGSNCDQGGGTQVIISETMPGSWHGGCTLYYYDLDHKIGVAPYGQDTTWGPMNCPVIDDPCGVIFKVTWHILQ
jgi:hypothetical protein